VFGPGIAERVISFFAIPRVASAPDPFPQLTPNERSCQQQGECPRWEGLLHRLIMATQRCVKRACVK
jgi:hypothetical protein